MKFTSLHLKGKALLALGCVAAFATSASATIVWQLNPDQLNTAVGATSHDFTSQGFSITASAFNNDGGVGSPTELYFKNEGPVNGAVEFGLGVTNTPDHELEASPGNPFDFIQFNLTSIIKAGATNGGVSVGSVQPGEGFAIYGSNTAGHLGTQLGQIFGSSFDNTFVALPSFGQYDFYSVIATANDVLPIALEADIAPVPEMNALFPIVGLVAAVGSTHLLRRRQQARATARTR